MKKGLCLVLVCLLLMAIPAFGFDTGVVGQSARMWVYQVDNTTGDYQTTDVATNLVTAKSRILGFSLTPKDPTLNSELIVGLWDDVTDEGYTVAELINEAEAESNAGVQIWFPYPITIISRLNIRQGANTTFLLYYEK